MFNTFIDEDYFKKVYPLFKLNIQESNKVLINENHYVERKICIVVEGNLINVISNFNVIM